MARNSRGFTPHELEIAIKVLIGSKAVKAWVKGQARAYSVDLSTPEGKAFAARAARQHAEKLIQ